MIVRYLTKKTSCEREMKYSLACISPCTHRYIWIINRIGKFLFLLFFFLVFYYICRSRYNICTPFFLHITHVFEWLERSISRNFDVFYLLYVGGCLPLSFFFLFWNLLDVRDCDIFYSIRSIWQQLDNNQSQKQP
jgi:hypothetical protein